MKNPRLTVVGAFSVGDPPSFSPSVQLSRSSSASGARSSAGWNVLKSKGGRWEPTESTSGTFVSLPGLAPTQR